MVRSSRRGGTGGGDDKVLRTWPGGDGICGIGSAHCAVLLAVMGYYMLPFTYQGLPLRDDHVASYVGKAMAKSAILMDFLTDDRYSCTIPSSSAGHNLFLL